MRLTTRKSGVLWLRKGLGVLPVRTVLSSRDTRSVRNLKVPGGRGFHWDGLPGLGNQVDTEDTLFSSTICSFVVSSTTGDKSLRKSSRVRHDSGH